MQDTFTDVPTFQTSHIYQVSILKALKTHSVYTVSPPISVSKVTGKPDAVCENFEQVSVSSLTKSTSSPPTVLLARL